MTEDPFLERLRALIGRECRYLGRSCRIVELLSETDSGSGQLVLEAFEDIPPIQTDQFGQALFRANEHLEVPIQDRDGNLSEDLMLLLDGLTASEHQAHNA
jgi:hypothetical protein